MVKRMSQDDLDRLHADKRTTPKRSTKVTAPKGCSGNNGAEHVYAHVQTTYIYRDNSRRVRSSWGECIGCGHTRRGHKGTPTGTPDVFRVWNPYGYKP